MKKLITTIALIACIATTKAQTFPQFEWAKLFPANSNGVVINRAIAVDLNANVYNTGSFGGNTVDLDPSAGSFTVSAAGNDVYITKLDALGNFMWAKQFVGNGGSGNYALGITTDALGNVYTTGFFAGTIDFDPGAGVYTLSTTASNSENIFVSKLDASGNFVWAKQFESTDNGEGYSIKVDNTGNVFCAGWFSGTVDFDPNAGVYSVSTATIPGGSASDGFVVKLDATGNLIWVKQLACNNVCQMYNLQVDMSGNIVLSGIFVGTADFDPNIGISNLTSLPMANSSVISKLDNNGNLIWVKQFDNIYLPPWSGSTTTDPNDNIYVTGGFLSTTDFDPSAGSYTLASLSASTTTNGFILKLSSNGNFLWVKQNASSDYAVGYTINSDTDGDAYITGGFYGTVDLNPTGGTYAIQTNTATGCNGIYVAKYDASGNFKWGTSLGSYTYPEQVVSMAVDANKNIYTSGSTVCSGDFDPGPNTYTLTSTQDYGAFVQKMSQCTAPTSPTNSSLSANLTICEGSSTTLSVTSTGTVSWYATPTSTTVLNTGLSYVTPTLAAGSYTYYTEANTCTISATRTAITVTVSATCQDVWPGDANSDGIANNLDFLELGLHYLQTGTPRASTSNLWQSYNATNWTGTITNGKNINHSNCNGDGIINDDDTLAIFNNYSLTHTFKITNIQITNPDLSIIPDQTSVVKGTWGTASIYLGSSTTPINNVNGIAFTVNYDNTLIDLNSVWIEYPTSFINANNQNLHFRKLDFSNNILYTATTHTQSGNVSGNGKIAILHYKIKSSLNTDNVLNLSLSQANQSNATGSITPLSFGTASLMAIGASVSINELENGNSIFIYPNPTSGSFVIELTSKEKQTLELYDMTGSLVYSQIIENGKSIINASHLSAGVYNLSIKGNSIMTNKKLVIVK